MNEALRQCFVPSLGPRRLHVGTSLLRDNDRPKGGTNLGEEVATKDTSTATPCGQHRDESAQC